MDLKILYEDSDVLVIDKPAGIVVFREASAEALAKADSLIDSLIFQYPELKKVGGAPRYGIVHRLDKNTSGILLVAKTPESLIFLQKQFSAGAKALVKTRELRTVPELPSPDKKNSQTLDKTLEKRYIALVCGNVKDDKGIIHTLIGRSKSDPRKQKATWLQDVPISRSQSGNTGSSYTTEGSIGTNPKGKREAISEYKVIERFQDPSNPLRTSFTLLEVQIKTGRKHQIRAHMAYIHHPIAGDKLYGFKDSPIPQGLERQFLHASYLKIQLLNGQTKEFKSELPEDLQQILNKMRS